MEEFTEGQLAYKLFPDLKVLVSVFVGFVLAMCYGDVSRTSEEFAAHPDVLHVLQIIFRPGLVIVCWFYIMRTFAYNRGRRSSFFMLILCALVCAAITEFASYGLPLVPDIAFYASHPSAIHLMITMNFSLGTFFLCIGFANVLNWGKTEGPYTVQARSAAANCMLFFVALFISAIGLLTANFVMWAGGYALMPLTFIASISIRTRWRATRS
jgi:hypothetical protein